MSRIPPARTTADRARVHIKALLDEAKHQAGTAPAPAQMFFAGMLSGLTAGVEILDGGTAEGSMERMVERLGAAIGQAYLDGKLPPQPPAPASEDDRPTKWIDGHPQLEAMAAAVWEHCDRYDSGLVIDDPRNIAVAALAAVVPPPADRAAEDDQQLTREQEIRGVQAWMALDLHQALGWSLNNAEHEGRKSWADWWAELLAEVRILQRTSRLRDERADRTIGQEGPDADRRAAGRTNIHKQLDRVGRGEVLGASEAELLRNQVGAEMREADTARAVAAGNLRHVKIIAPELEAAEERARRAELEVREWKATYGEHALRDTLARLNSAEAAVVRVRRLSEMTIQVSMRVGARQQALDTLAALDNVSSPADAMQAAGSPVTTDAITGLVGWVAEGTKDLSIPILEPRLLDCGLCYEEQGEEVHPHPECPIGSTTPALREQIAAVIAREFGPHKGRDYGLLGIVPRLTDELLAVILPATRITATLARDSDNTVQRVIALYEQWVKAGPPPLGTSMPRWWDRRLAELHAAILPPADQPKES